MSKKHDKSTDYEDVLKNQVKPEQTPAETETTDSSENEGAEMTASSESANETEVWKDKYLRLYAEFDNYRKRTIKEKSDIIKTAGADIIRELLPVVDDFERAMSIAPEKQTVENMREGIDLIHKKLSHNLKSKGLEPMEAKGKVFDSEVHEAITSIPAPEESLKGCVIDEVEKGYLLNGQVIRFAKVVVGQ